MKPKSGFVFAVLTLCAVTSVNAIDPSTLGADHVRKMHDSMTQEARDLLLELTGEADEKMTPQKSEAKQFRRSRLTIMNEEERRIVSMIYASQGRTIEITDAAITVHPNKQALERKRQIERKEQAA